MNKKKKLKVYVKYHEDGYIVICNSRGKELPVYIIESGQNDNGDGLQQDFETMGLPIEVINLNERRNLNRLLRGQTKTMKERLLPGEV